MMRKLPSQMTEMMRKKMNSKIKSEMKSQMKPEMKSEPRRKPYPNSARNHNHVSQRILKEDHKISGGTSERFAPIAKRLLIANDADSCQTYFILKAN